MLRISKLTDYAVVLATELSAGVEERAQGVRELALRTGIPQPTASKVLKKLARAGIVASQRGVHGGYLLARPAEAITVAEIIAALEGPIAVTECSTDETAGACDYEGACGTQANWQRINLAVQRALEDISLAEMAGPQAQELVQLGRTPQGASAPTTADAPEQRGEAG